MIAIGQTVQPNAVIPTGAAPGVADLKYGQVSSTAPAKVIGSKVVNGKTYYNIDQTGIGGGTGWVDGGALESALGGGGTAPANNSSGGNGAAALGTTKSASLDLQALYDSIQNDPAIKALNDKVNGIDTDIAAKKKAAADEAALINDNPYQGEATRTGKLDRLTKANEAEINNLLAERNSYANQITSAQQMGSNKIDIALKQNELNRQAQQDEFSTLNSLISTGALAGASDAALASISSQTGVPIDMLKNAAKSAVKPQIFNSNGTIVAVDPNTGNVISKNVYNDNAATGGSTSAAKNVQTTFLDTAATTQGRVASNGAWQGVFPQLVYQFAPYMSLEEIYKYYAQSDPGKKYGTPNEDAKTIQKIYKAARGESPY